MEEIKKLLKKTPEIMSRIDEIHRAIESIKQDRVQYVKDKFATIGRKAELKPWDDGRIVLIFNDDDWGDTNTTDLEIMFRHSADDYTLEACDKVGGKVWTAINQLYPDKLCKWDTETAQYSRNKLFQNKDLVVLEHELRRIIKALDDLKGLRTVV